MSGKIRDPRQPGERVGIFLKQFEETEKGFLKSWIIGGKMGHC
jgi:hypothetical protein